MNNQEKIIKYLKEVKKATTIELMRNLWIASPRKEISVIRRKSPITGITIISERVSKHGKSFNEYRLAKCKKAKFLKLK